MTDRSLLDEFVRHGNEAAFAELAKRHQGMAFAAAYRVCGDRGEAQDILQQALIVLARRSGELGDVRCLSAWLHRVVILEAKKARRKSANRRRRETMAYQLNTLSQEEREIAPHLDESLNAMGEKDREVLTLHYLEGRAFKAIAESLGGTAEGWQKRSVRALAKLSGKLKSRGVTASLATLGVILTSARAEAGVSTSLLESITRKALTEGARNASLVGKTTFLLTMKTGIAISLASGMLLAYGWGVVSREPLPKSLVVSAAPDASVEPGDEAALRNRRDRGFTVEMVKQAVQEYEHTEKPDPLIESRLRSLMFLVPKEHLDDVLVILMETKDHSRFQQVAAALFGCWAEYDPAAALARAREAADFSYQAKRAVMVTWLNQDPEAALSEMLKGKSEENRGFLTEYLAYQCERKPQEAALLVDRVAKDWPEADRPLFEMVAKIWARTEPLAAGEWVASYPDDGVKGNLLKSMAVEVAKIRGFDGLAIANHIEDAKLRAEVRDKAIYWWAVTTGGISLIPGEAKPVRDLSGGFPADWTDENIRTFAFSTMVNYSKNLPDLLKIAKDDEQRMLIYEGALRGSGWSNPAAVTQAAEQLPESFADTPQGKDTLQVFVRRWNEMDPKGVVDWLSKQPPGSKTDAMRTGLKTKGTK
ncbi:MAG: sigma-70 family RNA polymerase sigma factor [Luteolibacter sp.]